MADEGVFLKIVLDGIQDIKQQLTDVTNEFRKTASSVQSSMSGASSKVGEDLSSIGGAASKASASTQESLSETKKGLTDMGEESKKTASTMTESFEKVRGALALIGISIGFYELKNLLHEASQQALEQEKAMSLLSLTVKNSGVDFEKYKGTIESVIQTTSEYAKVQNDEVARVLQSLILRTGSVGKSLENLNRVFDFARIAGMDAGTAAFFFSKGLEGNIEMLGRVFPPIKQLIASLGEHATQAEKTAGFIKLMDEKARGAYQAMGPYEESVRRIGVAWYELLETLGNSLQSATTNVKNFLGINDKLIELTKLIRDLQDAWDRLPEPVKTVITVISGLTTAIIGLTAALVGIKFLLPTLITVFHLFAPEIFLISTAITGVVTATYLLIKNWDDLPYYVKKIWGGIKIEIFTQIADILEALSNLGNIWENLFDRWKTSFHNRMEQFRKEQKMFQDLFTASPEDKEKIIKEWQEYSRHIQETIVSEGPLKGAARLLREKIQEEMGKQIVLKPNIKIETGPIQSELGKIIVEFQEKLKATPSLKGKGFDISSMLKEYENAGQSIKNTSALLVFLREQMVKMDIQTITMGDAKMIDRISESDRKTIEKQRKLNETFGELVQVIQSANQDLTDLLLTYERAGGDLTDIDSVVKHLRKSWQEHQEWLGKNIVEANKASNALGDFSLAMETLLDKEGESLKRYKISIDPISMAMIRMAEESEEGAEKVKRFSLSIEPLTSAINKTNYAMDEYGNIIKTYKINLNSSAVVAQGFEKAFQDASEMIDQSSQSMKRYVLNFTPADLAMQRLIDNYGVTKEQLQDLLQNYKSTGDFMKDVDLITDQLTESLKNQQEYLGKTISEATTLDNALSGLGRTLLTLIPGMETGGSAIGKYKSRVLDFTLAIKNLDMSGISDSVIKEYIETIDKIIGKAIEAPKKYKLNVNVSMEGLSDSIKDIKSTGEDLKDSLDGLNDIVDENTESMKRYTIHIDPANEAMRRLTEEYGLSKSTILELLGSYKSTGDAMQDAINMSKILTDAKAKEIQALQSVQEQYGAVIVELNSYGVNIEEILNLYEMLDHSEENIIFLHSKLVKILEQIRVEHGKLPEVLEDQKTEFQKVITIQNVYESASRAVAATIKNIWEKTTTSFKDAWHGALSSFVDVTAQIVANVLSATEAVSDAVIAAQLKLAAITAGISLVVGFVTSMFSGGKDIKVVPLTTRLKEVMDGFIRDFKGTLGDFEEVLYPAKGETISAISIINLAIQGINLANQLKSVLLGVIQPVGRGGVEIDIIELKESYNEFVSVIKELGMKKEPGYSFKNINDKIVSITEILVNNLKDVTSFMVERFNKIKGVVNEILDLYSQQKDFSKSVTESITEVQRSLMTPQEIFTAQIGDIDSLKIAIASAVSEDKIKLIGELKDAYLTVWQTAQNLFAGGEQETIANTQKEIADLNIELIDLTRSGQIEQAQDVQNQIAAKQKELSDQKNAQIELQRWQSFTVSGLEEVKKSGESAYDQLIQINLDILGIQKSELDLQQKGLDLQKWMTEYLANMDKTMQATLIGIQILGTNQVTKDQQTQLFDLLGQVFNAGKLTSDEQQTLLQNIIDTFVKMFEVPKLAEGKIVTKPTLAVVGEDGPEAVIPLNKPDRMQKMLSEMTTDTIKDVVLKKPSVRDESLNYDNLSSGEMRKIIKEWIKKIGFLQNELPAKKFYINIPQMAQGGLITKPTLAMIGESGPEMVTPITKVTQGEDITISIKGPLIMDDITMTKFARRIRTEIKKEDRRYARSNI